MKKIFLLVVLFSSIIFSQENPIKSIIELKQQVAYLRDSLNQNPASVIQNPVSSIQHPVSNTRKKNAGLAILYSLVLPGMGELYAGSYESGKYFTIADGILWGVFAGFNIYGNWQEDNYKSFAQSRGGVSSDGKDEEYYANIGIYQNIDDYNTERELNREYSKVYKTSTHYWQWAGNDERKEYRSMWSSSESAYNNVRFAVGALILNRIVSAINAVRLVSAYNKNLTEQIGWNVSFGVENTATLPSSFTVNFVKSF
ncbi:MAG: hypothetical protein HYS25_02930 [Ignavibacteriales bacterium]|nr:hypothetical protein [Ignavibacteriales bacterium]